MYLHNSFTNKICHTSSFLKQIYFNLIIQPEELIGKMTFYILSAILHYSVTSEWVKCLKSVCRLFKEVMWSFTVHFKKLFKIDIHSRKDGCSLTQYRKKKLVISTPVSIPHFASKKPEVDTHAEVALPAGGESIFTCKKSAVSITGSLITRKD